MSHNPLHSHLPLAASACEKETLECLECAIELLTRCCYALEGKNYKLYRDLTKFFNDYGRHKHVVDAPTYY